MNIESFAVTDVGQRRPHNEDTVLSRPDLGLYVVCDGMGGHAAGEIASQLAAEAVAEDLEAHIDEIRVEMDGDRKARRKALGYLEAAIREANRRVYESAQDDPERRGMGTTLTLVLVHRDRALIGQVGDSRLYLVRGSQAHLVTTDHTIFAEMVRAGRVDPDDKEKAHSLNALTRAVGVHANVDPDTLHIDLLPGDIFLLCSDGLHGFFDDLDLPAFFAHNERSTAAANLVEFANKSGGHDNISAVVLYNETGDTEQSLRVRLTLDTLKQLPLFHYLTFAELLRIIPVCRTEHVATGDVLIEDGSTDTDFYIVVDGKVRVHKGDTEIAVLGAGKYFGEMSLVDNRPRSASVTAVAATHLIRISRADFYEVLRSDPVMAVKLLWNFIQTLSSLVRTQNETLDPSKPPLEDLLKHPYDTAKNRSVGDDDE